jgi:hypothetical protein
LISATTACSPRQTASVSSIRTAGRVDRPQELREVATDRSNLPGELDDRLRVLGRERRPCLDGAADQPPYDLCFGNPNSSTAA